MKKLWILAAALIALQSPSQALINLSANYAMESPNTDAGLGLEAEFATPMFSIGAGYLSRDFNSDVSLPDVAVDGITETYTYLLYNIPGSELSPIRPFLGAGYTLRILHDNENSLATINTYYETSDSMFYVAGVHFGVPLSPLTASLMYRMESADISDITDDTTQNLDLNAILFRVSYAIL